ncbi:MAG: alpha/beta fold hydrolase, partial [Kaistella sp.]
MMLNYEISGKGKENLVLLHGFMENLMIWEEMENHLSKDFTLIKIDLPGHGLSKIYSEIHTMEFMAEEVQKLTNHLKIKNFHLLGHSMGG